MNGIKISVVLGNAFKIEANSLILKFAQSPHGLDGEIIQKFKILGISIEQRLPKIGDFYFSKSFEITNTENILFLGVPPLGEFGYKEIREFGKTSLRILQELKPNTKSIVFTIHGTGYGLDEIETFRSQIAGILDGINIKEYPENIEEIIFIEKSVGRAQRLQMELDKLFPHGNIPVENSGNLNRVYENYLVRTLQSVGLGSENKRRVFVAMPFSSDFDDCFHYGIQGAVNSCGYLCERADLQSFTGDVMEWVKNRIASADFIIADLTTANPNVYLEVGYAWGQKKKTILLIRDSNELKFDTKGQRCLTYNSIKDLEWKLTSELQNLSL